MSICSLVTMALFLVAFAPVLPKAFAQSSLPPGTTQVQARTQSAPPARIDVYPGGAMMWLIHFVPPVYPAIAEVARIQGTVTFHVIIGEDGAIREAKYISGPPLLMHAALDAVKQWRYLSAFRNGQPAEVNTNIPVIFDLSGTPADEVLVRKPSLAAGLQALLPGDIQVLGAGYGYKGIHDFEDAVFAARDLGIPFAQLKCTELGGVFCSPQTTAQGMSLSKAIQALKPEMSKDDVKAAEKKAKEEAKSLS